MELVKNPTELSRYARKEEHFELTEMESEWLFGILEGHDYAAAIHENKLYRVDVAEELSERSDKYAESVASLFWWAYRMWEDIVESTENHINDSLYGTDTSQEEYLLACYKEDEPIISALEAKVTARAEERNLFIY